MAFLLIFLLGNRFPFFFFSCTNRIPLSNRARFSYAASFSSLSTLGAFLFPVLVRSAFDRGSWVAGVVLHRLTKEIFLGVGLVFEDDLTGWDDHQNAVNPGTERSDCRVYLIFSSFVTRIL